jgi:PAS domain S-box-containing protein
LTSKDNRLERAAPPSTSSGQALRKQAEEIARERAAQSPDNLEAVSHEETQKTLHELRVHQIELEMQNEELRRTQAELDAVRGRYFDIYDLAPVGYCTLSEEGVILEANLTAANLLGVTRDALVKQPISRFIFKEDQDIYYLHRKQLFETGSADSLLRQASGGQAGQPRACELRMLKQDGVQFCAWMEATVASDIDGAMVCRVVLNDITGRKRAEEAEKFKLLFNSGNDAVMVHYMDAEGISGNIVNVNDNSCKRYGWSKEEFLKLSPMDIDPTFESVGVGAAKQLLEEGKITFETIHLTKNGGRISVEVSASLFDMQGKKAVLSIVRDITERKRVEEALRESEVRFRLLFENMESVFTLYEVILDKDGRPCDYRYLEVNPAFEKLTGMKASELTGRTLREVFPLTEHYWFEKFEEVFMTGISTHCEKYSRELDTYIELNIYTPQRGQLAMLSADITDRKRAEDALARTRIVLEQTFEQSPVPMALISMPDAVISIINPACREHLGMLDEQSAIGTSLMDFKASYMDYDVQGEVLTTAELPLARSLTGTRTVNQEGMVARKDGTIRWHLISAIPIYNTAKEIVAAYLTLTDITERKRAEEELRGVMEDLDRSNKDLQQFASIASHDLQEPLRMVGSYTQLLAKRYEGQLDEKAKEYIAYVVEGAARMQRLVNDLLTYSRVGTRGNPMETRDSHSILGEAIENLAVLIGESKAIITVDVLPIVSADASQLVQVFQNLLANAIKFRGGDIPRIHVSVKEEKYEWVFSVRDNGIGIGKQYAERIFLIFQRLHTREEYPGTGIGLAVCKRIVERHGGRIWFESEPGKGSVFFFTVPK